MHIDYAAGYFESSTGLVKLGTRYDNPALGRWTQQDPVGGSLGNSDNLNRYLYVGDDPVNLVDPSGAYMSPGLACILGAIGSEATLILGGLLTSIFDLGISIPITLATVIGTAIVGCFGGVIVDFFAAIAEDLGIK